MREEEQLSPEIYQLLAAGRKIAAIKLIREETGMGLAEAKKLADALSGHDSAADEAPPALKEEGGASGVVAIVIAVLIAAAVYVFFLSD
jgi:ribosomal protein L7/L12